jgi:hypothetical protein
MQPSALVGYFIFIRVKFGYNVFPGIVKAWLPSALTAVLFLAVRNNIPAKFSGSTDAIYFGGVAYLLIAVSAWLVMYRKQAGTLLRVILASKGRQTK